MTRWAESLIKLSTYEVETLQKRLAEIADQRQQVEMKLAALQARGEAEQALARADPANAWSLAGYMEALKRRMDEVRAELRAIELEEQGARDALAQAFETQKKYEHIAEQAELVAQKKAGRIENARMDELGLRKTGGR
jgi:flagellar FliJ protein